MLVTSARATPKPNKRKGRAAGTARPNLKLRNISVSTDTIPPLQLQCLARYGVTGAQAALIAPMIWNADAAWGDAA